MKEYKISLPERGLPSRSLLSNVAIVILSVGLLTWALRLLQLKFTTVPSIDAVINGAIVDINAPREGLVTDVPTDTGEAIAIGQELVTLENDQVSELQIQEITTRLNDRRAELERAQVRLAQLLRLQQTASADDQEQYRLENLEGARSLNQLESDLRGAESRLRLAQISYDRATALQADGAVSLAALDSAQAEMEQRQAEVDSLKDQIMVLRTDLEAASRGLNLDRTRSNYDPRVRLQELQLQIIDQQQVVSQLEQAIASISAELEQAKLDAERRKILVIDAKVSGVLWSLEVRPGTYVQQGDALGQVLDCDRRWIDATVDERMLRSLTIGTPATVELYGYSSLVLEGEVSMIRPGLGRLVAGDDVLSPIAANTPRTAQVRIDITEAVDDESRSRLCYVGHTGKVQFDIR